MITTTLFGLVVGIGLAALLTLLFGVYSIGPTERGVPHNLRARCSEPPARPPTIPSSGRCSRPRRSSATITRNIRVIPQAALFQVALAAALQGGHDDPGDRHHLDPDIQQDTIEAVHEDNLTVQISGQDPLEALRAQPLRLPLRPSPIRRGTWSAISSLPAARPDQRRSTARRTRRRRRGRVEINDLPAGTFRLIEQLHGGTCRKTRRAGVDSTPRSSRTSTRRATWTSGWPRQHHVETGSPPRSPGQRRRRHQKSDGGAGRARSRRSRAERKAAPILELPHAPGPCMPKAAAERSRATSAMPLPRRERAAQTVIKSDPAPAMNFLISVSSDPLFTFFTRSSSSP